MIPCARLNDIDQTTIRQLLGAARESRTLDFKEKLDLSKDGRQALAEDVCAFANTVGGDLVFGIREEGGVAAAIVPLQILDLDAQLLTLTNFLRDAVEPRVATALLSRAVPLTAGGHVVVLRVAPSPNAPHRVLRTNHFYVRNSVGKETMDIHAIRTAFAFSEGLAERVRSFRDKRLEALRLGEAPVKLRDGPLAVLHVVPVHALTRGDAQPAGELLAAAQPLARARPSRVQLNTPCVNLEGVICASPPASEAHGAYAQLFRDGVIELAGAWITFDLPDITNIIDASLYEHTMIRSDRGAIVATLAALSIPAPGYLCFSLLRAGGHSMQIIQAGGYHVQRTLPGRVRDIVAPPVYLENWDDDWLSALRPAFDTVWNAVGIASTQTNFAADEPDLHR